MKPQASRRQGRTAQIREDRQGRAWGQTQPSWPRPRHGRPSPPSPVPLPLCRPGKCGRV